VVIGVFLVIFALAFALSDSGGPKRFADNSLKPGPVHSSTSGPTINLNPVEVSTTTTAPPETTLACPTRHPQAAVSVASSPDPGVPGYWRVSLNGTGSDVTTAPVTFISASVQFLDASGNVVALVNVYPGGVNAPVTLQPGQSVPVSNGGPELVRSTGNLYVGSITVDWDWPAGSPYAPCPSGTGP
jgi:hypothetical protein